MKLYVVVRVTDTRVYCVTRPAKRDSARRSLEEFRRKRPGTDHRLAELTIPTVAPYSDYWIPEMQHA